jgi:hypothetical protein
MATMEYQATTCLEVGTSITTEMVATGMEYIPETGVEALKYTTEGTSHDMTQTGVVQLMCGAEEAIMEALTKMIMLEKEPLVFMEGADDNRSMFFQCRETNNMAEELM